MTEPIIQKGKSDKYYKCNCGSFVSVQYYSCPVCNEKNNNQQIL